MKHQRAKWSLLSNVSKIELENAHDNQKTKKTKPQHSKYSNKQVYIQCIHEIQGKLFYLNLEGMRNDL